jgi:hypothetical protein
VLVEISYKLIDQLWRHKKLEICLLEDVALGWAPAVNGVCRFGTIYLRLGVDREKPVSV